MKKRIFFIFTAAVLCFASCSDGAHNESETVQTLTVQEAVTTLSEDESAKTITSEEMTEAPPAAESETSETDERYINHFIIHDKIYPYGITVQSSFSVDRTEADIRDYDDKEIAVIAAYTVCRDGIYDEYKDFHSALVIYTDGACAAAVFKSENGFLSFLDNSESAEDYEKICFDKIGTFNSDISEKLNECISLINVDSELKINLKEEPAVADDGCYKDSVIFYANVDGRLYPVSWYNYLPKMRIGGEPDTELDDYYASQIVYFLVWSDIADYWLENYAWKIGEYE